MVYQIVPFKVQNENDTIGLSFKLDGLHAFDRNDLKIEEADQKPEK